MGVEQSLLNLRSNGCTESIGLNQVAAPVITRDVRSNPRQRCLRREFSGEIASTYPPAFSENKRDLNGIGIGHLTPGIEFFERFNEFIFVLGNK